MVKTSLRTTGVQVEGLDGTIRALRRFSKEAGKEAVDVFRVEAKMVQAKATANAHAHPSSSGATGWIGRSATGKGAGVSLLGSKTRMRPNATEFGMHRFQYRKWGGGIRGTVQRVMRRRTFRAWKGNQHDLSGASGPGYVIQPAIRKHLPGMEERVANRLSNLLRRQLDKAGVPRG